MPIMTGLNTHTTDNEAKMKAFPLLALCLALLFLDTTLSAQDDVAPELEFVCELKVSVDPGMVLGQTAHGERRIIPITGGTFEGPLWTANTTG